MKRYFQTIRMIKKSSTTIPAICVIGGDGIGPEVTHEVLRIFQALHFPHDIIPAEAGFAAYQKYGTPLPDSTITHCRNADSILFGAVTTPPNITGYSSPIIGIRKALDLYANVRPFTSVPVPQSRKNVDILLFRENTEDVYAGQEHKIPDGYCAERIITKTASRRILRYAFETAKSHGRKKVTAVHKANILRLTDGLFLREAQQIAKLYPDIEFEDMLVDACAFQLVRKPEYFDVIVTTNMFGDILSDEIAGLAGGLGLAASANIGETHALFEPVHGSAPKYAGLHTANPTAAILAGCLLMDYHKHVKLADAVRRALLHTIQLGVSTPDLGGSAHTQEFTNAVISAIHV